MSVRATIQDETTKIHEYNSKMVPGDEVLRNSLRQQKPKEKERQELLWEDKPLYDMYHRQIQEVADV